jgi:HAMP domain-containing protein
MKYTVVIRQPVPDDLRPHLEGQLVERFGLSPEQAQRLAARRSGRLMKPTGRARADLLLRVFESVGAQAALEEVREETGVLSAPFEAVAPFQPSPQGAPDPGDDVMLAPDLLTFGALDSASGHFPVHSDLNADPFAAHLSADPFAVPVGVGAVAAPALGGSHGPARGGTAVLTPDLAAPHAAEQPQAAPAGDDIWSDFTGALTVGESRPQAEGSTAGAETFLNAVTGEARGKTGRRRSLAQQMTFGALAPLALSTALTLGLLTAILPGLQRQLVQQNAQAVAVAVGTSLDTRDQETVNAQLDALLRRSAVGFVRVELPDGTTYFRSQTPQLDGILQGRVASFLSESPDASTFVSSGSAADAYREQLAQLEAVGAGQSAQAQELRTLASAEENQRAARNSYVVSVLGVVETENGQRTTADAVTEGADLLYRIAVGVSNTEAAANLRNTLLLVLGVSLLALALAAALAVRAARRVVQPIERLVKVADAISMGDLSRPVMAGRNDEIGDLAQALERMRLSLESAMERLRRRKRG